MKKMKDMVMYNVRTVRIAVEGFIARKFHVGWYDGAIYVFNRKSTKEWFFWKPYGKWQCDVSVLTTEGWKKMAKDNR